MTQRTLDRTTKHGRQHHPSPPKLEEPEARRPWTTLGLMIAAQIMVILDVSVVNVAMPSIGKALALSSGDYQWLVSAYVLFSGGFLLLGGRLADMLDRRRMFHAGLAVFTGASLVSGLASGAGMLIAARAAQGLGAAMLTPAALSIVMTTYAGRQRSKALAVWGAVGSAGIAAGVLAGGVLTSALGWRAVFFVNVPIGIVVGVASRRIVPRGSATRARLRQLDLPGALTLVAGLVTLVYAIEGTQSHGWATARTWTLLAAAAALLTTFAVIERKSISPLVPPQVWRIRSLITASVVMAGVTGMVVGTIFLTSLYLQRVVGSSAVVTGLQFLPLAAAITASATAASKLVGRLSPRAMIAIGLVVMSVGALVLAGSADGQSYLADVLPGFLLIGAGVGPMFVAISVAAMGDVQEHQSGLASGVMMTGHEVGAALGVSLLTAVGGDLTTTNGVLSALPRSLECVAIVLGALVLVTLAMPKAKAHGHAAMHH
jgi:EmrB/QacA subfamily drug resistance transporter